MSWPWRGAGGTDLVLKDLATAGALTLGRGHIVVEDAASLAGRAGLGR